MRRIARLMLVVIIVIILTGGCSTADPIEPGTPKNVVLKRYGKPDSWFTISVRGDQLDIGVVTYWSGAGPERGMPLDEIWVFEYETRHEGEPACLYIENGVVKKIVKGFFPRPKPLE